MACLDERFAAHLSAVNLTANEARHKLTMCLDKRHSVTGRLQSDLDIAGGTDRRCGDDKLDKRSEEFNCWALSGCLVNNGVTS